MNVISRHFHPRKITKGRYHYFFGYFDKCPWSVDQRYILAHRTEFMDRQPTPDDVAVVGIVDTENDDDFIPLSTTSA